MIGRVLLAALLSGIVAGLVIGVVQHVRLTPLIIAAEQYEGARHVHEAGVQPGQELASTSESHTHGEELDSWSPAEGFERSFFTTLTLMITGAAFAAILTAVSMLTGLSITPRNGAIWGLCGFIAVSLAPAAGLPPELPGMPAADIMLRQVWWLGCIASTGLAIYLYASKAKLPLLIAALGLLTLPHLIGAPVAPSLDSTVPAALASAFAANALAVNALFWLLIGSLLGFALRNPNRELFQP